MSGRKSAAIKAEALRLRDTGLSYVAIATKLRRKHKIKLAKATVQKWVDERDADATPDVPAPPKPDAPTPADVEADDASGDDIAELRGLVREQRALAKQAREDGNSAAAAKALKAAGEAANTIARLKAKSAPTDDAIVIPRAEYVRIRADLAERVRALGADLARTGGLVCGECGRRIRIELASQETHTEEARSAAPTSNDGK